ncbi:unnamed protein product [Sphagnum troendelagicum]|uniref:MIP18 family-like domain-containing protein n=1 Tax=Sphagnum troendelagicum TaxID=128251 RepID=A0ABP0U9H4_9BRYO
MVSGLINANPVVHERKERSSRPVATNSEDSSDIDHFDSLEIFDILLSTKCVNKILDSKIPSIHHVRDITDPEHPYSLEQLNVVTEDSIFVDDSKSYVKVTFTPTVQHCSMATVIGLSLRLKLLRCLPPRFKVDIQLAPGSHSTEAAVNKQLNDKERVAAAFENPHLVELVEKCLVSTEE